MRVKKTISLALAIVLLLGMFVLPASAAQEKQIVTEHFVDSYGKTIAAPATSTAEAKNAPDVGGYDYSSQSTKATHVYAEEHIQYIIGYPDGSVKVEQNMCRSEAVAVLYRLYNGNYPAFTKRMSNNTFSDVTSKAWFYKELETLYNVGIIDDDEYFRPNDPITRAEFAIMCAKYDGLTYLDKAKFSDVKPGHWAYSYINAAAEKGWINGYPDGTFRPDNYITRAEVMSLVNRLVNRPVTKDRLPANVNPYNDITESHWAYCDAMEATVKHDAVNWHGAQYNNSVYNIVIERFVDTSGKEISKPVTTQGKPNYHPVALNGYNYLGYITEITYVYNNGEAIPSATKTANIATAKVGDTITYTVTIGNDRLATADWESVVMSDELSGYLTFSHGSVQLDGKSVAYSYSGGKLIVELGSIAPNSKKLVTFDVVVNSTAYNTTIRNTAIMTGENTAEPVEAPDKGITIGKGVSEGTATKSASVSTAKVGDIITYTMQVKNSALASYPWENATITDTIPTYLTFIEGSVQIGGKATTDCSFDGTTLKIFLGDIKPGETVSATFRCKVNGDAQGRFITNVAYVDGDNHETIPAPDKGVEIDTGLPMPSATKSANVREAKVGEVITYTITAKNNIKADAVWKNVLIYDLIPDATTFIHGSVYVNGQSATYSIANHALSVRVGDIVPGDTADLTGMPKKQKTHYERMRKLYALKNQMDMQPALSLAERDLKMKEYVAQRFKEAGGTDE